LANQAKFSLHARIVSARQTLARILDSFWAWMILLFSKLTAPLNKFINFITPKSHTENEGDSRQFEPPIVPKIVPPPPPNDKPEQCRYPQTPWWKTTAEMVGIVAVVAYTIFSGFQMHYARQQARAGFIASKAATDNLKILKDQFQLDQRPYVAALVFQLVDFKSGKQIVYPVKGKPIAVNILIKNLGKSPAFFTVLHRHILFGTDAASEMKIEPPDKVRHGITTNIGEENYTTAVSVKDTYAAEVAWTPSNQIVNWDGSMPIVVFGRMSYQDGFGNSYCTPYVVEFLSGGSWVRMQDFRPPVRFQRLEELCPEGAP
jgi:hypothetical protein